MVVSLAPPLFSPTNFTLSAGVSCGIAAFAKLETGCSGNVSCGATTGAVPFVVRRANEEGPMTEADA